MSTHSSLYVFKSWSSHLGKDTRQTLGASMTDWRLHLQLPPKHSHIKSKQSQHMHTWLFCSALFVSTSSRSLCLHHHLVSYFLFPLSDKIFCPSAFSLFSLSSSLSSALSALSVSFVSVSHTVSFTRAHKWSPSFFVFWTQTVDHALIYFSSLLFLPPCSLSTLSLSPALYPSFWFGLPLLPPFPPSFPPSLTPFLSLWCLSLVNLPHIFPPNLLSPLPRL